MINFIKGIFVGIFNIVPGLSGSVLLIILNLYEKCISAISNFFKKPKETISFLFPIFLGIVLGTYLFSKVIFIFIKNYPEPTFIVFTGFLLGTIPHLLKEAVKNGFKDSYIIPFLITLSIGILMLFLSTKNISYAINYDFLSILKYFLIGALLSISTIIPGISSTVLLSIFNIYGIYIYSISSLNLFVLIPTSIGFIITTFLLSKIINYSLNNYYGYTYFAILGFSLATIPTLMNFSITFNFSFLISVILGILAFILTNYTFKVMK